MACTSSLLPYPPEWKAGFRERLNSNVNFHMSAVNVNTGVSSQAVGILIDRGVTRPTRFWIWMGFFIFILCESISSFILWFSPWDVP